MSSDDMTHAILPEPDSRFLRASITPKVQPKSAKPCGRLSYLFFCSPQGGTPPRECSQTTGINLPLKILVREDQPRQVMLSYNDPLWIAPT
jgi:hypothetical protein